MNTTSLLDAGKNGAGKNGVREGPTAPASAPGIAPLPLLLTQEQAWAFVGLSRSAWYALRAADALPKPIMIPGAGQRWRRKDLEAWVDRLQPTRQRRPKG
jgi:predicted DNA-binding transcriptional regulator AlpA